MRVFIFARCHFKAYLPQPITWDTVGGWLSPFSIDEQALLAKLITRVRYIDDHETRKMLVEGNNRIIERLDGAGIGAKQTIYVQFHDAGSSSGVMLNALKVSGRLEGTGRYFIDANSRKLGELTSKLKNGAIIYVDDFAGSGKQFINVHKEISQFIIGNFAEFFLAPCVTTEAATRIDEEEGVEVVAIELHSPQDRALNENCTYFRKDERIKLIDMTMRINPKHGLGFKGMATMVVYSRQCPSTVPFILRGSKGQTPFPGILPRTTDRDANQAAKTI
jgi:hypothetical protein